MARRYGIWYEWKGGVEEAKVRQRKGRVTRSRGMIEGEEEGRIGGLEGRGPSSLCEFKEGASLRPLN
jgi:hypothetical protein